MAHQLRLQSHQSFMTSWAQEAGRGFAWPPPDYYVNDLSIRVYTNEQGHLLALPENTRTPIELARFVGDRRKHDTKWFFLLNGDGFEGMMQTIQARIRRFVGDEVGRAMNRITILPHAALQSAQLNLDTIEIIHASRDRNITEIVKVPIPPMEVLKEHVAIPERDPNNTRQWQRDNVEFDYKTRKYASRVVYTGHTINGYEPQWHIMHRPEFAAQANWFRIREVANPDTGKPEWVIETTVHQLGATVFRAVGPDGVKHRWLSGFDQNEPRPLYFLAQLPDAGGVRYYTHALRLLAPKIVHAAREEGRSVFRQGDIFAISTDMTDEDLADAAVTRRENIFMVPANGSALIMDVSDQRHAKVATSPKMRRGLMIYGTSHTATEVAVTPDRGTFVRGTMYHDPILENIRAGRQPDHVPVDLTPGVWHLCVRNTVPRLNTTTTEGDSNARNTESMPDVQQEHRRARRVPEPVMS